MTVKTLGTSGSVVISVHIFILAMLKTRVLFMMPLSQQVELISAPAGRFPRGER